MVIFGKKGIYKTIVVEEKPVEIGVQFIKVINNEHNEVYFYKRKELILQPEEIDIKWKTKPSKIEKFIREIIEMHVEAAIEEINTKKMIFAQGRGISTDLISEVQGYIDLDVKL